MSRWRSLKVWTLFRRRPLAHAASSYPTVFFDHSLWNTAHSLTHLERVGDKPGVAGRTQSRTDLRATANESNTRETERRV